MKFKVPNNDPFGDRISVVQGLAEATSGGVATEGLREALKRAEHVWHEGDQAYAYTLLVAACQRALSTTPPAPEDRTLPDGWHAISPEDHRQIQDMREELERLRAVEAAARRVDEAMHTVWATSQNFAEAPKDGEARTFWLMARDEADRAHRTLRAALTAKPSPSEGTE